MIRALAHRQRVLLLGGHAIIFHGLDRPTIDSYVWVEPLASATDWCAAIEPVIAAIPGAYYWDLAHRQRIQVSEVPEVAKSFGVVRIGGIGEDLDIFRRPNNFQESDFDEAWSHSATLPAEEARVFSPIELLLSKVDSERQKDFLDVAFLEAKIRREMAPLLRECPPAEARRLFARYVDHETCRAALANPHAEVRALATETLRELAAGQNPFAREILEELDRANP